MNIPMRTTLVAACLAAFASTTVLAQTPPSKPQAGRHAHSGMEQRPFSKPSERVEARLAYQKTALKITDAQTPQWNAYAEFARKQAKEMEQRFDKMRETTRAQRGAEGKGPRSGPGRQRPNAIESLERRQGMHAEAIRLINDRLAVQKPLYAALSPEQQKVADTVLNPRMGRAGPGGRGERGDHGHRGKRGNRMQGSGEIQRG
jgi:uncharacterized coiled-coil protein SlyX